MSIVIYEPTLNEEIFIKYTSKNEDTRKEITDKFDSIKSRENEDMAALWLECNTWRSLVAIDGEKEIARFTGVKSPDGIKQWIDSLNE